MGVIGVIAEYNPFHSGHKYHLEEIRRQFGADCGIVCVMSGNWVQRGDAAITDKWTRARFALQGGADLILELPTLWAAASAEAFARGSVSVLTATGIVDRLSFGSEAGELAPLQKTADFLLTSEYDRLLRASLDEGLSFPLARQYAAQRVLGPDADCLKSPNNNLGIEYLRALRHLNSPIAPSTIGRRGVSHDSRTATPDFASASHLRAQILGGSKEDLSSYLSEEVLTHFKECEPFSLGYCTRGVLARLRTLSPEDFLALPDCSEGLHHKLAEAVQNTNTLEELYATVKSRRYTHARIRRLVLWAFLGLRASDRPNVPPYLRVLGMNRRGQALLKKMKTRSTRPVLTKAAHIKKLDQESQALFHLEQRCTQLYQLCARHLISGAATSEFTGNPVVLL